MKPRRKEKPKKIPNSARAICEGKIATIFMGRRVVNYYRSGQPLMGRIADRRDGML